MPVYTVIWTWNYRRDSYYYEKHRLTLCNKHICVAYDCHFLFLFLITILFLDVGMVWPTTHLMEKLSVENWFTKNGVNFQLKPLDEYGDVRFHFLSSTNNPIQGSEVHNGSLNWFATDNISIWWVDRLTFSCKHYCEPIWWMAQPSSTCTRFKHVRQEYLE